MCPTTSISPSICLFSLDQVLPVVVPFCDEGVFIDDQVMKCLPVAAAAAAVAALSPSRLNRPIALPSIDCSLLVTPPRKDSSDSLSPSTPDSGFSSDDGGPSLPRLERSRTLASALRKHRSSVSSRKSVRFADSLGLDLEKMEYFTRDEENLFANTMPNMSSCSPVASTTVVSHRLFPTNFVYRSESESISRTRLAHVNISSLRTTHAGHLTGQINVLNLAYDKKITIRYTMDGWLTHFELSASFSHKLFGNEDIDAFSFVLAIPHQSSTRCEMCVSYTVSDGIFWDNNGGANYLLEWVAREEKPLDQTSHVLSRLPSSIHLSRFTRNESDDDLLSPIDKLPSRSIRKWRAAGAKFESSAFV
ncbi:hypothetical protein PRIPAC_81055 [Pristionchus pacificus]|uniref:CBM21 domain-containing protein n=1 Tax=Pristionchus pacificus TaxID=54126 RepID=A0A2A6CBZ7_PRIPA|nr:hypothetical protein PRIPAC_81055 [Pristionchus pacificus]|eukprot:PDM75636.1 hypothetical protein PRIPAC_42813 [Pristionchus pacificus]